MKQIATIRKFRFSVLLLAFVFCRIASSAFPITGVINYYASVTGIAGTDLTVASVGSFSVGDKILIIQMKGVSITTSNTASYGDITSYNNSGNWEFNYVTNIVGNVITIQNSLTNTYTVPSGLVQIVNVPYFCDIEVTDSLTCQPWDGSTGGILIFESGGTVTLNADIDVSGKGFRGGPACSTGFFQCNTAQWYVNTNNCLGGKKGEGVAEYVNVAQSGGRAKLANGGGGGNPGNNGGGGGGNYGGGGLGGFEDNSCIATTVQGIGGLALDYSLGRIWMGGAGGSGTGNNASVIYPGTNGGGIIMIAAVAMKGNGFAIRSEGVDQTGLTVNEGAGGGGAGGTVCLDIAIYNDPLLVSVEGGDGGSTNNDIIVTDCTGPGGGGGGGVLWVSGATSNPNITFSGLGGNPGLALGPGTSCLNTSHGAAPGNTGATIFNYPPVTLPTPFYTISLGNDTVICPLAQVQLDPGIGLGSYLWQDGSTDTSFTAVGPGTYSVLTTDGFGFGCFNFDTIVITALPPTVYLIGTGDTTICPGQQVVIDAGAGYNTYIWQDSSALQTFTTTDTGIYTVTVVDSIGCLGNSTYQVFNFPPTTFTIATGDTTICPDQPVVIDAGPGYAIYDWQDTTSTQTYLTTDTGTYTVVVFDSLGCQASSQYQVFYFPNSTVFLGNDTLICFGDSLVLDAGIFPQYLWNNGSQNKSIMVDSPGVYSITVVDFNNCIIFDTLTIDTFYMSPPLNLMNDTLVCTGTITTVLAPSGYLSYEWDDGTTFNFYEIEEPGFYTLTVENENTCKTTDTFFVKLECPTALFVPTAFTPNGDGVNDIFFPIGYNITSFFMQIYNRWGRAIYETNQIEKGWPGECEGVPCEIGSYVYYIVWTGSLHGITEGGSEKGNVTLIR